MKTYTALRSTLIPLCAFAALASTTVFAQTAPPTPQSVAPGYTPPTTYSSATTQTIYHYKAPHAGTWDFYPVLGYTFWDNTTVNASHVLVEDSRSRSSYRDGKIKMDLDDSFTFGLGVGYNFTEQFSVHGTFTFADPDYKATFTTDDGASYRPIYTNAYVFNGDFAARYDLTRGKIRPYVQGSVGFMYIDTNIANGNGYYYPYNDYYNYDYYYTQPTVNHTYLSLGATAGVRWDFSRHVFGQLSYTASFVNTSSDWMVNHTINLAVGWNY